MSFFPFYLILHELNRLCWEVKALTENPICTIKRLKETQERPRKHWDPAARAAHHSTASHFLLHSHCFSFLGLGLPYFIRLKVMETLVIADFCPCLKFNLKRYHQEAKRPCAALRTIVNRILSPLFPLWVCLWPTYKVHTNASNSKEENSSTSKTQSKANSAQHVWVGVEGIKG